MMHEHDPEIGAGDVIELDDSSPMVCPSCGTLCELSHKYCPGCGFPMEKLREQPEDPLVGCTLPGGHVVLELIDVGGMGRVYRAEQKMLGRTVAVKIIHPHLLGDETVEARFITEARAASQLNHPNSVGVIDFGKFEGRLYMVMEYIRGRDLATVAHEEGPLEIPRIVDIVTQSLAALEEAHAVGIIHRDLKPENIVLSPLRSGGDFVKVLDFGLAKVLQESTRGPGKRITDPGMVCGTPEYMAPEQARGEDIDPRTDLYACGVLLYELVAGQLPFEGNNPREVVLMHLSKTPPELSVVAPHRVLSPALRAVIDKALSKKPADRFQSASEFTRALREATADKDVVSSPAEATVECQSCGAEMPASQKFCGECGSKLGSVATVERSTKPASASVAPPPGEELPFVGRDDELGFLFEQRDAATQQVVACQLVGHAGSGKTRLLQEFTFNAEQWGDRVVTVGPDPWWAGQGYHALKLAVQRLAGLPADGGSPAQWPGASPEVRVGLNAIFGRDERSASERRRRRWSETPPLGPGEGNQRLLVAEALRWALSRGQTLAEEGNVVLAIDDLHAVDGASRNAFVDVVNEPPLVPALLIASHRPSFDSGWEGTERLEVRGLPTNVAASLLGGRDSQTPADDHDDRRVSPMYVDQLRRFTAEGGDDPPSKLADLIALRVERLPAGARRLLQALAIRGDATTSNQLQSMLPEEESLLGFLPELEDAGFVSEEDGLLRTTHPLVRDVAMAGTPAGVRKNLHARVRRGIGGGPAIPLEADAVHAYHGEQSFEALMLLERVSSEASSRDDPDGSVRALRMAMEMARREMSRGELDDPVSAVLMFSCKLGDALCQAGKPMDAEGVLSEALNLAGPASSERSRILASYANAARQLNRPDLAFERLDEAVAIAERGKHEDLLETLERMRARWVQGLA